MRIENLFVSPDNVQQTNKTRAKTQNVLTRNRTGVVAATKRSTDLYTIKTFVADLGRKSSI